MKKLLLLLSLVSIRQVNAQTPILYSTADTVCVNHCIFFSDSTITTKPCTYTWIFTGSGTIIPCSGCTRSGDTVTCVLTSTLTPFPSNIKVCYPTNSALQIGNCFSLTEKINSGMGIDSITKCITVVVPPIINFNLQKDTTVANTWNVLPNYPINISTANWNWGDGTSTIGLYPSHTYTTAGWYNICVTASLTNSPCTPAYCHNDTLYKMAANNTASSMVYVNVINNSSGIHELNNINSQVAIYPSPTSDQFFIDANTTDKLNVDLYDVNGRHVFSTSVSDKSYINITILNAGVYSLTIKTADRVTNKKLVILR